MGSLFDDQTVGVVFVNNIRFTHFFALAYAIRLDFRRLPGPVFDPPRKEKALSGDECGLIFPNSGW